MAIVGNARTFDRKFAFLVHFGGSSAGFMKMSALESETADIKHFEGGALIANKQAGRVEFKDVTLERGATRGDYDLLNWYHSVATGAPESSFKRNVLLQQLERDGRVIKSYTLFGAWPKSLVVGDWDNNVDENVVEKLTLAYDYFQNLGGPAAGGVSVSVGGGGVSISGAVGVGPFSITGGGGI